MRLALILLIVVPMLAWAKPATKEDLAARYEALIAEEKAMPLPGCRGLGDNSLALCERVRKARELASACGISVYRDPKKGLMREFCIIAHELSSDTLHEIRLVMPVAPRGDFQPRVVTEHEPPYVVLRFSGSSYIKFQFGVYQGEERLYPYAAKYLDIPDGTNLSDLASIRARAEEVVHLFPHDYLNDRGLGQEGHAFIRDVLGEVHAFTRGIPSKAFPGKSVADIVSVDTLVIFLVMEQTDHDQFFRKDWVLFHTGIEDPFEIEPVRAVFVNLFVNGLSAYSRIRSKGDAFGTAQFIKGTYGDVHKEFPSAALDPDFRRGTRGFRNSMLAAALLIDLELSKGTKRIREDFERERDLGMLYAAAAYNGGGSKAQRLAEFLERDERETKVRATVATIRWGKLLKAASPKKFMRRETVGYVRKFSILRFLYAPQNEFQGASP